MINDYECPRCHNKFPSQNVVMHDRMCTEQNPMPLDKSREVELRESNNSNNNVQISNSNLRVSQENKNSQNSSLIPNLQESQLNQSSRSGVFPDIFTCEICHEVLPESEKKDHMYCHELQNEENNAPNNEDEFRITQSQIDNQREIESIIEREKEERRQQQNQRNQERRRRNENNTENNRGNRNVNIDNNLEFMDNFFRDFSNMNINSSNRNNPSRGGTRQIRIQMGGPNGPRIVQQYSSNDSGDMNNIGPFNMVFNNSSNMSQRRMIPFIDFINNSFFNSINLDELVGRMRNIENPTDQEILNELPETKIDDVSKLDPEKRNCVICLEDFKNGDNATVLPCIHMFHTPCIQNWLKTQNSCPICKFKLTGENINSQH